MWRNRGWAGFTSRHHGFGRDRGECVSLIYAKLVLLPYCFPRPRKCVPARQPGLRLWAGEMSVWRCRFVVNFPRPAWSVLLLCWTGGQLNVQEDAAPRNMNGPCGRIGGAWPGFTHTWSRLMSLSCFCPALAVQNKPQIDVHGIIFFTNSNIGFSCAACHRLTWWLICTLMFS